MKFSHLSRLHSSDYISENQTIIITNTDFHYLKSVLRMRVDQKFRIFNSTNGEFLAIVKNINRLDIEIYVESLIRNLEKDKDLTLALCIIKQDRMIEAIKAATQLGVTNIIPIYSSRSQYKNIAKDKIKKCMIQATEQCERLVVPNLEQEITLVDFCKKYYDQQIIFAYEAENENNKINDIKNISNNPIILIGPEGGFSDEEIKMVKEIKQIESISLGKTVLRSEIAAISALACVSMLR